ncbi:MAG: hypothetical protein R3C54_17730 [Parvularculaceae bacterium]|nr:hypothetical protein [Caulobacterales bacterium]
MADGAPTVSRRRSRYSFFDETDPRFSGAPEEHSAHERASHHGHEGKERPRVAFTGEEFGFGYQATGKFLERARRRGTVSDGGLRGLSTRPEREYDEASPNAHFDYSAGITQPLRTKEQALMAVKTHTADFALVPFYNPYAGYDYETLRALGSLLTLLGVEQVSATDNLCLAVHESQLYDIIQSAHPGTGFSALQRRFRKSWGTIDSGSGNAPGAGYEAEMPRAGLPIDMSDQKLIRDRIDLVFAGPEAARRCKSKLDGLRATGVDVRETPQMVEPHRELARLARSTATTARQTNTYFDPMSGETRSFSTLGAEAQAGKLFGMVLPYEVAMRSSDYIIVDHNFDDAPADKTRFMVVENNLDHTLVEDAYRTTDARTRYWTRRLSALSGGDPNRFISAIGSVVVAAAITLMFFGALGASSFSAAFLTEEVTKWLSPMMASGAIAAGGALLLLGWLLKEHQSEGATGVRLMLRFKRDETAASIGDVENYLRNFGVRHTVVRMDEDSEGHAPASILLDIELAPVDFVYNPWTMLTRRLRGSVANGALKKAFSRWKNRGVLVLAAMTIEKDANGQSMFQLPQHKQRRWWAEGLRDLVSTTVEELSIRFMRVLFYYLLPAAIVLYILWKYALGN